MNKKRRPRLPRERRNNRGGVGTPRLENHINAKRKVLEQKTIAIKHQMQRTKKQRDSH